MRNVARPRPPAQRGVGGRKHGRNLRPLAAVVRSRPEPPPRRKGGRFAAVPTDDDGELVVVNGLTLDPQRWGASAGERRRPLTRPEFSRLLLMARQPGRAFTRDELLDSVWGSGYLAGSNVVDQARTGRRPQLGDG